MPGRREWRAPAQPCNPRTPCEISAGYITHPGIPEGLRGGSSRCGAPVRASPSESDWTNRRDAHSKPTKVAPNTTVERLHALAESGLDLSWCAFTIDRK